MKKDFLKITKFEEILKVSNRPEVPAFNDVPEDLRAHFQEHYKKICISEAANDGQKLDWNKSSQRKYIPWFIFSPSGFSFYDTHYDGSYAYAGDASRLCFIKRDHADHAGKTFPEIFEKSLTE